MKPFDIIAALLPGHLHANGVYFMQPLHAVAEMMYAPCGFPGCSGKHGPCAWNPGHKHRRALYRLENP